jgi:hypothetical protein
MISALVFPSKFMEIEGSHAGMTDYVGLIGIFCLPLALLFWRRCPDIYPFAITSAVAVALSLGGIFSCIFYFFPSMHLFRHIGFLTGIIKMLVLIMAGFGIDLLIDSLRKRSLIPRPTIGFFLLICLALVFYLDLNLGGDTWAAVCETILATESCFSIIHSDAIYTLARGLLIFAFACSAWQLCRSESSSIVKKPDFALLLFTLCVIGDCLLFQAELYTHYIRRGEKFDFPAIKLNWPADVYQNQTFNGLPGKGVTNLPAIHVVSDLGRFNVVPTNTLVKYQTWTNTPGPEYQAALSCVLQWDPSTPSFRADWVAKNVSDMQKVLRKTSKEDLAVVSGDHGQKFRLLPDANAIHVKSDQDALELLRSRTGWDTQVILTGGESIPSTDVVSTTLADSHLELNNFSANHFSLTVSNGMSQSAWLIYADAHAPGWHAAINGRPVPIIKAYAAYKAIHVQPGISQVQFSYHDGIRSTCFSVFAVLAAAGAAVGLLWLLWVIVKDAFAGLF